MYRFILVLCACLIPLTAMAQPKVVALADLTSLTDVQLAALSDPYFKTFQAQVAAAGAKANIDRAKGALKAAQRAVGVEEADQKAAKAEMEAAKKNNDERRLSAGAVGMAGAEEDLKTARAFEDWKKAQVKVAEAETEEAEGILNLRLAEFQLAMATAVAGAEGPAAPKYSLGPFQEGIAKASKKVTSLRGKSDSERAKAAKLKAAWEARSGK